MRWPRRSSTRPARRDEVAIGIRANGAPLTVPLTRVSTLIAGLPGAGKSSTLGAVIAGCVPMDNMALVVLDPKRVQFTHTVDRCMVAKGTEACGRTLDDLVSLMELRYELLEDRDLDEWPAHWGRVLVLVDELAELMASGDRKADVARSVGLRRVLQLGRAAGITVVGATQRPSASLIDSDARALFGARLAHALDGPESVRMSGLDPDLAPAHKIPLGAEHAGLCYVATDGTRTPVYGRVWSTPRDLVGQMCARHRALYLDPFASNGTGNTQANERTAHHTGEASRDGQGASREQPSEARAVAPREGTQPAADVKPSTDEARVLEVITPAGRTSKQLAAELGLTELAVVTACNDLVTAGRIVRGKDNRWRTPPPAQPQLPLG